MEGNIISFKVVFDKEGRLLTELSALPEEEIKTVFSDQYTQAYIRTILRECHLRFDDLHEYLEKNLQALHHE